MKKLIWVILVVFLVSLVAGCGQQAEAPKEAKAEKLRIAVVFPSTIDDMAWSQSMYEALKAVQAKMGADKMEISTSERMGNAVEAGTALRQYASQGFDIVIAHGSQYQSVIREIAKDFPKTTFAYGAGFQTASNVFVYDPHTQDGAYMMGIIAAKMTKSGTVGVVGPVEAGDAAKYNFGFKQGVEATNPNIKVRIAYTGSFNDLVGAGELAKVHMDAGADFLTGSSQQAIGAIRAVATRPDRYWLSVDLDQSSIAPNTVMASVIYRWEKVVGKMIELRKQGVLGGQQLPLTLADGTLEFKYNEKLVVPKEVKDAVDAALKKINSGELKVQLPAKK